MFLLDQLIVNHLSFSFADEIIKRKLLIEGDGGNDDRRLTSLLKMFVKWSQVPADDEG